MKNRILLAFVLVMLVCNSRAQNINNSLRIAPGSSGNGYVAINSLALDTLDFTVELWLKIDSDAYSGVTPFNDPAIFCNKDWNSGSNTGVVLAVYTGGTYKVNFTPVGISRVDVVSSGPQLMSRWNHIAVTVERLGYIRLYTNGILTDSVSIRSGHGKSIDGTYPYNLCDDGTGAYPHPFSGNIDEFRVWRGVRSASEIRKYMCRTLPAGAANWMVYYPMQQTSGLSVTDASGSGHNGTLTHLSATAWGASNAAVGDSSAYLYTSSWSGATVAVSSPASGMFTAENISSGTSGVHVYRTNYPPNSTTGITYPGTDSVYFGVFPTTESGSYFTTYNYSGYPAAITYETWSNLFTRPGVTTNWTLSPATKNTTTHTFQSPSVSGYAHFVIGRLANTTWIPLIGSGEQPMISMYPNPAIGNDVYFNTNSEEKVRLSVFNVGGQLIDEVSVGNWPFTLQVGHYAAGSYYVSCASQNRTQNFILNIVK